MYFMVISHHCVCFSAVHFWAFNYPFLFLQTFDHHFYKPLTSTVTTGL